MMCCGTDRTAAVIEINNYSCGGFNTPTLAS